MYPGTLSIPDTVSEVVCMGGPSILSIPDTVCEGCMGGQLGRIPSIPGHLVFRTLCLRWCVWGDNSGGSRVPDTRHCVCEGYGGTTREDPEYPGTLSIPDTVSVRWYVWGDNSGGSRVSRDT